MQEEINVIQHLISVEKDAATLIDDAVKEADARTAEAKNKSNTQFKQQYDECAAALQKEFEHTVEQKKSEHNKSIEQFKADLENQLKDYNEFNKVLNGLLFGK
ncbi:MAG: hypothetical protein K5907_07315 [Treponema sp.]|nr:hypothetical protein [Treponema sp.]